MKLRPLLEDLSTVTFSLQWQNWRGCEGHHMAFNNTEHADIYPSEARPIQQLINQRGQSSWEDLRSLKKL